ncbi:hypothetical protein T459_18564 [Capsicum annuum]|uniref:ATP-dependent DNA helicase PIF1-like n=1 Tax=Capsicum annuum TaxID=4072 RepID=A0A2G2ZEU5_CAPAN|nr:hypothetical protein T459_18564 [Capsicum annuum]
MISLNHSEGTTVFSTDKICMSEATNTGLYQVHTPKFLSTIKCSGIVNHTITLKVVPTKTISNSCLFCHDYNKSQGQSLSHVGLYLKKPVFTHGQLYVALSRVTKRQGLKILTYDHEGEISNEATNVVFKEVYRNLSVD